MAEAAYRSGSMAACAHGVVREKAAAISSSRWRKHQAKISGEQQRGGHQQRHHQNGKSIKHGVATVKSSDSWA